MKPFYEWSFFQMVIAVWIAIPVTMVYAVLLIKFIRWLKPVMGLDT